MVYMDINTIMIIVGNANFNNVLPLKFCEIEWLIFRPPDLLALPGLASPAKAYYNVWSNPIVNTFLYPAASFPGIRRVWPPRRNHEQ